MSESLLGFSLATDTNKIMGAYAVPVLQYAGSKPLNYERFFSHFLVLCSFMAVPLLVKQPMNKGPDAQTYVNT